MPDQTSQHAPAEALRAAADAYDDAAVRRLDVGQTTALIADAVWQLALAEGRRQATEGWDREWGAQYREDSWVQVICHSEATAVSFAAGAIGHRAVSRLVGPWEPTPTINPELIVAEPTEQAGDTQ